MPDAPLTIILEMIGTILSNTINTLVKITALFGNLLGSLGFISIYGGLVGLGISIIVLAVMGYFFAKFFLGSGKTIIILTMLGLVLIFLFILGLIV